jgi:amino acid adenylation domain-containing protein
MSRAKAPTTAADQRHTSGDTNPATSVERRLRRLSPKQLTLLRERISALVPETSIPAIRPIPRAAGEGPLSFAQERLWLLEQVAPGNPTYNLPVVLQLPGSVHPSLIEQALSTIANRHEVLRSVVHVRDGVPAQIALPNVSVPVSVHDLTGVPISERDFRANEHVAKCLQQPFDLTSGPLLRATLMRLSTENQTLLVVFHHIVFDGWSANVFSRELTECWQAISRGDHPRLPTLPIQYADFASWQRELLSSAETQARLQDFWLQELTGAPTAVNLPFDRTRSGPRTSRGAVQILRCGSEAAQKLRSLSRAQNTTLFMALLSCFNVLLYRCSGHDDIVVGSPVSGRSREELEPLIGMFVNTVVLRCRVRGAQTFQDLIGQVRRTVVDAYAHQDLPFERLVAALLSHRDPTQNPLFNVMFAVQEGQMFSFGAESSTGPFPSWSKFDLTLTVIDDGEDLCTVWEYATDIFDAATVARLGHHFLNIVRDVATNPDKSVDDLALMTPSQTHLCAVEWNDTGVEWDADGVDGDASPRGGCIHHLFERQAARTPDAVAVTCGTTQVSYRELDIAANALAQQLTRRQVHPEIPVAVCMTPAAEIFVAILAVLKAGGVYVPLDPSQPSDRLHAMAADCSVAVVLTQSALHERVSTDIAPEVVVLTVDPAGIEQTTRLVDENTPGLAVTGDNLAYIVYTSGSTGRPKGVMVSHSAIANHMRWMLDTWPLDERDAVLQRTPIGFDAHIWEIFAPLLTGARVAVADAEKPGIEAITEQVRSAHVTVLQLTPSLLDELMTHPEGLRDCPSLARVFCGGEALSTNLAGRFLDRCGLPLYNLYGPTETTVDATSWSCTRGAQGETVPIGRPISNVQTYVLDGAGHCVPLGATGELYLGGAALARGYVKSPAITAERFVPSPFGDPGTRLYRTGDLVRQRPDGSLQFVGRRDDQVKLRGVRIELGEVQAALQRHPAVQACVVLDDASAATGHRLVAFLVASLDSSSTQPHTVEQLSAERLRTFLLALLPTYMVPSAFVIVDALPLTANGKVDRRALAQNIQARASSRPPYESPRGQTEERLAAIWASVLGVALISVVDDFFALGGHSLLASRAIARIRDIFEVDLRLDDFFATPTVRSLAQRIDEAAVRPGSDGQTDLRSHVSDDAHRRLKDHIAQLSDNEVDSMLGDLGYTAK